MHSEVSESDKQKRKKTIEETIERINKLLTEARTLLGLPQPVLNSQFSPLATP